MKKICFITTISLTLRVFVLKTAQYIHENTDWEISFICDDDPKFARMLPDYIKYIPVKMKRGISLSGIAAIFSLLRIFKRERFDLIQYSTPNASLYASLAGRLAGIKVRLYCQWGLAYVGFSGMKRALFRLIERFVCTLSTHIEPDSKSNLSFCLSERLYPENKGSVIFRGSACGVDLTKFDIKRKAEFRDDVRKEYGIPADAFVFGFVGRITRDKGINELLTAFMRLSESDNRPYLLLVGPNENDRSIDSELYSRSMLCEHIIYTGYTDSVERYLAAADVFVLPSYREGFGMTVIEAEAMGLSVIVSNIPGPIDAMKPNVTGLTVQKGSAEQLYDALVRLYSDDALREELSHSAVSFVEENFEQKKLMQHILADRKRLLDTK